MTAQSLSSLDPIWTTAPGTRLFGYLVYDQLIAMDENYNPQPQMAEGWTTEDEGRSYTISLRDGLKFHDGEPVRAQDCVPSIERWMARDNFGQILAQFVEAQEVIDDRSFRILLNRPVLQLPAALAKLSAPACLIMPERLAKTDPAEQVTEAIGSGPFRFLADEWVSGASSAYARFEDYVPRDEPVSGLAGGRVPAIGRIEISQVSDPSTAMSALMGGEQDYWDAPPHDLVPLLRQDDGIEVRRRTTSSVYYMMQFNHLQAPFNNLAMRRAVAMAVDQSQFLAAVSEPGSSEACYSYYSCESPYASDVGSELMRDTDMEDAKAALAEAGYNGEKVVLLATMEGPNAGLGQVAEDLFRRLGLNVELVGMDFASITQRRTNRQSVDQGGWSVFLTAWLGDDINNPAVHPMLRGAGEEGYSGWASDPELERLRVEWAVAGTEAEQKDIARTIQERGYANIPYVPLGSSRLESAYSKNLTGIFDTPVNVYWNIGKSA